MKLKEYVELGRSNLSKLARDLQIAPQTLKDLIECKKDTRLSIAIKILPLSSKSFLTDKSANSNAYRPSAETAFRYLRGFL